MDISALNFNTQNVSVILNSSAFIEASGTTQLCEGESVTLSATGGFFICGAQAKPRHLSLWMNLVITPLPSPTKWAIATSYRQEWR
ncbi:MAG: hypothetical protein H6603_06470 [Flavobacteriales bacterium]|nr:hypothetical protein [Flavobacteriales bacterium]